ncbi:MAG TPA: ice-binding family protein [Clostridium sp.]|uniref:ice-binding family protein n=1 Tax=Clostridium sp. TaxID=1506 RepID=UPI002F92925B
MNKKITSTVLAALMIVGSTSLTAVAAMHNGTVVIGGQAFDLGYANDPKNVDEISSAIASDVEVYVKGFDGVWINNNTNEVVDESIIPAVVYKNATGVITNFDVADKDYVNVAPVNLGTAGNYAILSKSGISSVPNSIITGNIGVSPIGSTAITGFSLTADATNEFSVSSQITGMVYASDYGSTTPSDLTTAVSNMETAYTDAAGRAAGYTELYTGDISGKTLRAGVYKWGTDVLINSDVTLSGGPNDIFIFQIAKGITQASGAKIILTGGAQAKNIFWQAAGTVSIGTNSHFEGNIMSKTNIDLGTNASINGRLLAQTAVTLDQSTVVAPK